MGRADQTTKVRGLFVQPAQIAEVIKRHPQVTRARLIVSGEMANDAMVLQCEVDLTDREGLEALLVSTIRDITKLRCDVACVDLGSLLNDGKVIEDARSYK